MEELLQKIVQFRMATIIMNVALKRVSIAAIILCLGSSILSITLGDIS